LKDQIEERLKFLTTGTKPRTNKSAMDDVLAELKEEGLFFGDKVRVAKTEDDAVEEASEDETERKRDKKKKDKKDKKEKKDKKHKKEKHESEEEVEEPPKKRVRV
jgi:nucleolar protein 56